MSGKYEISYRYTYYELEVHHIVLIEEVYNIRLDCNNLITLFRMHHEMSEAWEISKEESIFQNGFIIPYYGILNEKIIYECTAALNSLVVQNAEGLVDKITAYLTGFRTISEYQGKGYFSKLFKFMIEDLKNRGYEKVTIGVEPNETKNKEIYSKYGFNKHIKDSKEFYPNGTEIHVEYYGKNYK